jgi:PST family polysaccharide transporter
LDSIFKNTVWQIAEKTLRMGGGLLMSVLTAQYLGPEGFGLLNYTFAFATFFHVVTSLGMEASLVKQILEQEHLSRKIVGSAILLRMLVAFFMLLLALGLIAILEPARQQVWFMTGFLGLAFLFQSAETVEYLFQARQSMGKSSLARLLAFLISVVFRCWLIFSGKSVVWFAASLLLEAGFSSITFLFLLKRSGFGPLVFFPFDREIARRIAIAGLPMVFSSMVWYLYSRLDQVMIGQFLGDAQSGFFSVSTRIVEVFIFLPSALSASLLPSLISSQASSRQAFSSKVQNLFDVVFFLGLLVCGFLVVFAPWLIRYSFGESYLPASEALAIQGFVCLFTFLGNASQQVFIARGLTRLLLIRNICGAVLNICLNLVWIPAYGIAGACYATLLSTFAVNVLANLLLEESRPIFYQQLTSVMNLFTGRTFSFLFKRLKPVLEKLNGKL